MLQYIRSTILPSKPAQLLIQTGLKWNRDDCSSMAAALSYYALFSLFPLLLVILSVIGWLIGPSTIVFQQVAQSSGQLLPPEVHDLVKNTLIELNKNSVGAGIIGFGVLLWTASAVFTILRSTVNQIWRSPNRRTTASLPKTVFFLVVNKLFSFLLVLGTSLLLLGLLVRNIVIKIILNLITVFQEQLAFIQVDELNLARGLQTTSSLLLIAVSIGVLFKILPSVYVAWQDVWLSALITATLIVGLQQLVSNSVISIGRHFLSYGVIGSVMILMVWIFLTVQIFLLGCVFSYVYADLFGSRRHRTMSTTSLER
jgi:membrane protein